MNSQQHPLSTLRTGILKDKVFHRWFWLKMYGHRIFCPNEQFVILLKTVNSISFWGSMFTQILKKRGGVRRSEKQLHLVLMSSHQMATAGWRHSSQVNPALGKERTHYSQSTTNMAMQPKTKFFNWVDHFAQCRGYTYMIFFHFS